MKKIFSIILIAGAVTVNAQKKMKVTERNIQPFTSIEVKGHGMVSYTHSDTLSLKIAGISSEETKNIETKVENGKLIINAKEAKSGWLLLVSHNQLKEIICMEAGNFVSTKTHILTDTLRIKTAGNAHVEVSAHTKSMIIEGNDAANLKIEGTCDDIDVNLSDAASLQAYKLTCENANITTSDASSAKIYVANKLTATADNASSVKVKGDVKDFNVDIRNVAASVTRVLEKEKSKSDTTSIEWKGKKMIIIDDDKDKKKSETKKLSGKFNHWAGFSLGVNGFLSPNGNFAMNSPYNYLDLNYSRSINVQLNLFQHNFHLYKNYVNLVTGFGIEWKRYMLDNKTTLNADSSFTWGVIDNSNTYNFSKNLLRATMLQVPLLLEFNTSSNPKKAFHISTGVVGQFMAGSRTKQILELNGDKFTKIRKDNYNMNPVSVKAHASIGYSNITAFAEYNLTPLFVKNKGPQVTPFVIGVNLIPF